MDTVKHLYDITNIHEVLLEKDEDKKNTTILIRDCFEKVSGITEKRYNKNTN